MHIITLLVFHLMIQNVCLRTTQEYETGSSALHESECKYEKIFAREFAKWNRTDKLKVYTPNRSCFFCAMPKCQQSPCEKKFNVTKMNIYNNLFEFGLFAATMVDRNHFKIILNDMCYYKVEILLDRDNPMDTKIYFLECLTVVLEEKDDNCTEKLLTKAPRSFNVRRDCIFLAFAFVFKNKLHYSITFDCTSIPSLLLNPNTSIDITSKLCFIDKESKNLTAQYIYEDQKGAENGMVIMLPCTTGGFTFDDRTGHIVTGETCNSFMRNDTNMKGYEFVRKNLFKDDQSYSVESRPDDWDELLSKSPNEKYKPIYMSSDRDWKDTVEIKRMVENVTAPKKKARDGCKLVDASKVKKGPKESGKPPAEPPPPTPPQVPFSGLENKDSLQGKDKVKSPPKKPKISGLGGGSDTSRGSLSILSIKMKLIMFASNMVIIYHL